MLLPWCFPFIRLLFGLKEREDALVKWGLSSKSQFVTHTPCEGSLALGFAGKNRKMTISLANVFSQQRNQQENASSTALIFCWCAFCWCFNTIFVPFSFNLPFPLHLLSVFCGFSPFPLPSPSFQGCSHSTKHPGKCFWSCFSHQDLQSQRANEDDICFPSYLPGRA